MRIFPEDKHRKPLPTWVEERARDTPQRVYAIIPRGEKLEDGHREFTYAQLGRAINKMAWWLDENLGPAKKFDVLAYVGGSDMRYTMLYNAVLKTRRQVIFPLFYNTRPAHLSLLESTECRTLIASKEMMRLWETLRPEVDACKILTMPDFEDFLVDEPVDVYPFDMSWDETKHDPVLILHTSGSTGLPKPIKYTSYMLSLVNGGDGLIYFSNTKILMPLPPSWILGLYMYVQLPLDIGMIPILLPPDAPLPMTAAYIDKVHTTIQPKGGIYVPSTLTELAQNPKYVDNMRHMDMLSFGGAPLDRWAGDLLSQFVHVQPAMGSTEVGAYQLKMTSRSDWVYYFFDPAAGFKFLPFKDDLFESVVVKHKDPELATTQIVFHVFPELQEYYTKDLWRKHPDKTKDGLWLYSGRTDDFVKLSSLTKFKATDVEPLVMEIEQVKACVMGGDGREVPFLLVELVDEKVDKTTALEDLWPKIERINGNLHKQVSLEKEMILFTSPGKPLKRLVVKTTVNRRVTLEDYEVEIDGLYRERAARKASSS